ncbi:DGK1 [Candida pseudojiufengensis]|uniref:DGK1 n=1 Tax=Candida pseudojiufengensis TaxID=497109 RepID=UPI0022241DC7|nr:DGK1 [Candida pseudojiufengensis]KAI5964624.1 DGK1 [Candida pseudojiufengensis]
MSAFSTPIKAKGIKNEIEDSMLSFNNKTISTPNNNKINSSYIEEEDKTYIYNTTIEDDISSNYEEEDDDDDEENVIQDLEDEIRERLSKESNDTEIEEDDEPTIKKDIKQSSTSNPKTDLTKTKFEKFITKHEIPRKVFHSSIGILTLWLYTKGTTIPQLFAPLLTAFVLVLANDLIRLHNPEINKFITSKMWFIIRENEKESYNGVLFYLAGVLIVLYLYPKDISVLSILLLSWADTAASTVGRQFGKYTPKIGKNKSLAGSLGSFFVGILSSYLWYGCLIPNYPVNKPGEIFWSPNHSFLNIHILSLIVGVVASVSEFIDLWGLDDNFTIPVLSGTCLYWITKIAQS